MQLRDQYLEDNCIESDYMTLPVSHYSHENLGYSRNKCVLDLATMAQITLSVLNIPSRRSNGLESQQSIVRPEPEHKFLLDQPSLHAASAMVLSPRPTWKEQKEHSDRGSSLKLKEKEDNHSVAPSRRTKSLAGLRQSDFPSAPAII